VQTMKVMRGSPQPEISVYTHDHVKADGTFEDGELGAVHTEGNISISHPDGGCGMPGCECSPGHWISVALPRTEDGVVRGVTFKFNSREELEEYLTRG